MLGIVLYQQILDIISKEMHTILKNSEIFKSLDDEHFVLCQPLIFVS